jgi:hypothetical protein
MILCYKLHMDRRRMPTPEESASYAESVVNSFEKTGLDRETTLIMGGSALALAGIRPAGDLDLMVPGAVFNGLVFNHQTPSGIRLQHKPDTLRPFLESASVPPDMLSLDIRYPHTDPSHLKRPELDEEFFQYLATVGTTAEGHHYLLPEVVARMKRSDEGFDRHKDRQDRKLIAQYLQAKNSAAGPKKS